MTTVLPVPWEAAAWGDSDPLAGCLRTGPLVIGMSETEIRDVLSEPLAETDDGQGGRAYVYALSWAGIPNGSDLTAYAAVVYGTDRRAKSLQVSGSARPAGDWGFSGLAIGDPASDVLAKFGRPFSTSLVEFNNASLWSYGVWPFSFEVLDGVLVSIRIRSASNSAEEAPSPTSAEATRGRPRLEPSDPSALTQVADYRRCVTQAAARLERSGEAADIVAASALESCREKRAAALDVMAGDDWRFARVLGQRLDERASAEAQAAVVTRRAARQ